MIDIVRNLLGTYTPQLGEYFMVVEGEVIPYDAPLSGLAGLDWEWIAGFVFFSIVLYCTLRMIGGMFRNG